MKWKCPICNKEFENLGAKEFSKLPLTTLFGNFKVRDIEGNIVVTDRKIRVPVCSVECKDKNEEQYFVEEYKGNNIYCVNGKYMPYLTCDYFYDTIDGVKFRIDNPHLIPATQTLMHGLAKAMSGEPGDL